MLCTLTTVPYFCVDSELCLCWEKVGRKEKNKRGRKGKNKERAGRRWKRGAETGYQRELEKN
jgi:hypothetical protein